MLQNSRVTAFTVFELLTENQLGGKFTPLPTQIRVKEFLSLNKTFATFLPYGLDP